jgi:hypothetical protein
VVFKLVESALEKWRFVGHVSSLSVLATPDCKATASMDLMEKSSHVETVSDR